MAHTEGAIPTEEATGGRGLLLAILASLVLVTVATNTTAALAQPDIGRAFEVGPADTGWVVFGYTATFAVATALFGGIAARIGIIRALTGGVLLLAVGSALAAVAPSLQVLIGARLLQGLGSGAIPTLAVALIARRFDGMDRARAIGVFVAAVGAGQAAGPLLGGLLLELFGWRAAVSIGIVAVPAAVALWWTQERATSGNGRRLDGIGAVLVSVVVLATAFELNRLPLLGLEALTLTVLAVLASSGAALVVWTARRGERAFLPPRILLDPTFGRLAALGAIGMSAFLGAIVLVPVVAAEAFGLSGFVLGLVALPMALAAAVSAPNNALLLERVGPMTTVRLALVSLALGTALVGTFGVALGPIVFALCLVPLGLGFGILGPPLVNEVTTRFSGDDQPLALGTYNLVYFLGGAVGAAISSVLLQIGLELPLLAIGPVRGFTTAALLLAVLPIVSAVWLVGGEKRVGLSADQARQ